jgi:hypothetical protein
MIIPGLSFDQTIARNVSARKKTGATKQWLRRAGSYSG